MPNYSQPTGQSGIMEIRDNGVDFVDFWLTAGNTNLIPQLPWTYILNGVQQPWTSVEFARGGFGQRLGRVRVVTGQTVTFIIGNSGNAEIGGPTEFAQYISRNQVLGTVRIKVGQVHLNAIPYVRDNGVWKQVEPWAKEAGVWQQTT